MTQRVLAVEATMPGTELEELAAYLLLDTQDIEIRFAYQPEQGGAGGPDPVFQVVSVWLVEAWDVMRTPLIAVLTKKLVDWAFERLKRAKEKGQIERIIPHYVQIYGPDGHILKNVKVDPAIGIEEDVTGENSILTPREMPPLHRVPPHKWKWDGRVDR